MRLAKGLPQTALAMASGGSCAERVASEAALPHPPPSRRPQQPPPELEHDFVEEPAREFYCAVSLELLREPQQTDCCGHHLSLEVAQRLQGEGKPCPMCQRPHFTARPDLFHRRKVQQLTVRCQHKKNGCTWVGELGNLENHVTKCPKQPWQCPYCTFSGLRKAEEEHLSGCGQFPVPCPNGCEAGSVERCSLEQHLLECPLQLVGCEYAAMGCAVRLPRREMSEHIRQSGQEHLLKMCLDNLTLSRELSRKMEEKEQQIVELQEEMSRMEGRVKERMKETEGRVKEEMGELEGRVREGMGELEGRVREGMGELEGRMKERMKEMERRVKEEKGELEERVEERTKELERRVVERVREGMGKMEGKVEEDGEVAITIPPVEYAIPNFSALKAQDKEWRSPPFYSHRGGYKVCIGVWPNGACGYTGSDVSIMLYKMRDANTEGLKWPTRFQVIIYLLGQTSETNDREVNIGCQDDDELESQDMPSCESVLCLWNHSCIEHRFLCSDPPYSVYLKDDCLHITVAQFIVY